MLLLTLYIGFDCENYTELPVRMRRKMYNCYARDLETNNGSDLRTSLDVFLQELTERDSKPPHCRNGQA